MQKIAQQVGISAGSVSKILRENNIPIRTNSQYLAYAFNEGFFDVIDNEAKAYWLGFIYADGYIARRSGSDVFGVK